LVFVLHNTLDIPVYGLADCNPYGLAVLQTYFRGGMKNEMDGGDRYHVPIQWIGLRPSQLNSENENVDPSFRQMPREVYQKLTELDLKKINSLNNETNQFMNVNEVRTMEMELMKKNGWKVELESLHWLGIDFMSNWLENTLLRNTEIRARSYGDDGGSISDDGSVEFDPRIAI
jgi:meiotic recombination protein SPO11